MKYSEDNTERLKVFTRTNKKLIALKILIPLLISLIIYDYFLFRY